MAKTRAQQNRYYVYSLSDPETGKPFYIGKGKGDRLNHHEREARSGNGHNQDKLDKINLIISKGLEVKKDILKWFDVEAEAYRYESKLIKSTPNLTNIVQSQSPRKRYFTLYQTISRVMSRSISRCEAMKKLNHFHVNLSVLDDRDSYLKLIKAANKLANKNNWLSTECAYAK